MSDDEKIQVRNKIRLTDHGSPQLILLHVRLKLEFPTGKTNKVVIGRVPFRPVPTTDFIYEDAVRQVTGQITDRWWRTAAEAPLRFALHLMSVTSGTRNAGWRAGNRQEKKLRLFIQKILFCFISLNIYIGYDKQNNSFTLIDCNVLLVGKKGFCLRTTKTSAKDGRIILLYSSMW